MDLHTAFNHNLPTLPPLCVRTSVVTRKQRHCTPCSCRPPRHMRVYPLAHKKVCHHSFVVISSHCHHYHHHHHHRGHSSHHHLSSCPLTSSFCPAISSLASWSPPPGTVLIAPINFSNRGTRAP